MAYRSQGRCGTYTDHLPVDHLFMPSHCNGHGNVGRIHFGEPDVYLAPFALLRFEATHEHSHDGTLDLVNDLQLLLGHALELGIQKS